MNYFVHSAEICVFGLFMDVTSKGLHARLADGKESGLLGKKVAERRSGADARQAGRSRQRKPKPDEILDVDKQTSRQYQKTLSLRLQQQSNRWTSNTMDNNHYNSSSINNNNNNNNNRPTTRIIKNVPYDECSRRNDDRKKAQANIKKKTRDDE